MNLVILSVDTTDRQAFGLGEPMRSGFARVLIDWQTLMNVDVVYFERLLMDIRFHCDPDTDQPHIFGHGVTEQEVEEVLRGSGEDLPASEGSRMKLGQTAAGRYLQVIYVPDREPNSVFVITAYELRGKAKKAYRRRQRRKPQ